MDFNDCLGNGAPGGHALPEGAFRFAAREAVA